MWRFTIIDSAGNETEVDEPGGWEDVEVTLDRDDTWKGIFFGYLVDKLEFRGNGYTLLKDEFDINGVSGDMHLRIEFMCGEPSTYSTFYEGRFSFLQYSDTCGDICSVSIGIEDSNDIMLFRNNYAVDVDLNSNMAFDEVTALTDYDKLNFDITIPSRGILQRSTGSNTEKQSFSLLDFPGWGNLIGSGTGVEQGGLMPIYTVNTYAEIDTTSINSVPFYDSGIVFNNGVSSHPTTPFIDLVVDQALRCAPSNLHMQMRLKGRLIDNTISSRIVDLNAIIRQGQSAATTILIDNQILVTYETNSTFRTTEFDISFDQVLSVLPGDKIYVFDIITYQKLSSASLQALIIEFDPETFVTFTGTSYCDPTTAKSYMINEATSRTVEAITNNQIKFYSKFFGRLDSQPYAIGDSPCPGLFAISNGLNVRRRLLPDSTQPGFFVNAKKIFDDLNGIYNIGLTIEPDINRPGFNRLRFEDWRYFFQDDTGLIFNDAIKVDRDVDESRIYNRLQIGYNKWTAGQFTGLDEFMTKRKYRININAVDKELNMTTDIICSTYTIEITRRLDQTTEDWQYDNDIFGLCLNDDYEVATFDDPVYGSSSVVNVLDPNSCYNGRISPARCALNWFNYILQGVRTLGPNSRLIFTSGDGNYIAEYIVNLCAVEGQVLSENQTIDITTFEDITDAKSVTYPEIITFEHPLNWNIFRRILAEPDLKYKSILVKCNETYTEAWIKKLTYKPNEGLATVIAIPKNISIIPTPQPPAGCQASIVPGSITIDYNYNTRSVTVDFTEGNPGATLWTFIFTQGSTPGSGTGGHGTTSTHPFVIPFSVKPGTWSVFIVPYCDETTPGINYAEDTITLEGPPPQQIELSSIRVSGFLDSFIIHAVVVGGGAIDPGFSFNFGGCMTNTGGTQYCNGYPGAPFNPSAFATLTATSGATSAEKKFAFNTNSGGSLDKVVIFGMTGIDSTRIHIAAGETWTLEFV